MHSLQLGLLVIADFRSDASKPCSLFPFRVVVSKSLISYGESRRFPCPIHTRFSTCVLCCISIINVLWLSLYVPRRGFLVAMVVLACVRGLALVCRVLGGIDGRGLV